MDTTQKATIILSIGSQSPEVIRHDVVVKHARIIIFETCEILRTC